MDLKLFQCLDQYELVISPIKCLIINLLSRVNYLLLLKVDSEGADLTEGEFDMSIQTKKQLRSIASKQN